MRDTSPLKLRARDDEDLKMLSACLQDALVPVSDIAYLKADKRLVLIANRFRWESLGVEPPPREPKADSGSDVGFVEGEEEGPLYQRVNCAVTFDGVRHVRFRGLEPQRKDRILSLLAIENGPGAIMLIFSGGGAIRLDVDAIRCHLEDLGEPWPTRWRPRHEDSETPSPEQD